MAGSAATGQLSTDPSSLLSSILFVAEFSSVKGFEHTNRLAGFRLERSGSPRSTSAPRRGRLKEAIRGAFTRRIHVKANTVSTRKRAAREAAQRIGCLDLPMVRDRN